jgi:hypothetical protein
MSLTRLQPKLHTAAAPLEWLAQPLRPAGGLLRRPLFLPALAMVVPGVVLALTALVTGEAVQLAEWLLPGGLVSAFVAAAHRPGASALARVRKELHRPLVVAAVGATLLALTTAQEDAAARDSLVRAVLLLVLPLLGVLAFAESEPHTQAQWLAQPLPRWRLYAEKLGVVAPLAVALVVPALSLAPSLATTSVSLIGLSIAVGLGPVFTLSTRRWLDAALATWLIALPVPMVLAESAWLDATGVVALACAALTALPWLVRGALGRTSMELAPHRLWRVTGATPLGTLARKELRMQVVPWAVGALPLLLFLFASGPKELAVATGCMLMFGNLASLLAGMVPVASEHTYATHDSEVALVPLRAAWRVKVAVSFATALAIGVGLPALVSHLAASRSIGLHYDLMLYPQAATSPLEFWFVCTCLLWASGLLASTLTRRLTSTFFVALIVLFATLTAIKLGVRTYKGFGELVDQVLPCNDHSACRREWVIQSDGSTTVTKVTWVHGPSTCVTRFLWFTGGADDYPVYFKVREVWDEWPRLLPRPVLVFLMVWFFHPFYWVLPSVLTVLLARLMANAGARAWRTGRLETRDYGVLLGKVVAFGAIARYFLYHDWGIF